MAKLHWLLSPDSLFEFEGKESRIGYLQDYLEQKKFLTNNRQNPVVVSLFDDVNSQLFGTQKSTNAHAMTASDLTPTVSRMEQELMDYEAWIEREANGTSTRSQTPTPIALAPSSPIPEQER